MTFLLTTLADEIIEYIFMSQVGLANVVRGLPALRDEPVDDPPGRQNASKRPSSLRFPHRFKSLQVVFLEIIYSNVGFLLENIILKIGQIDNKILLYCEIKQNFFRAGPPPRYVRASHYAYSYAKIASVEEANGQWWTRTYIGQYMLPLNIQAIDPLYTYFGWENELSKY
jgi:hypothetical protein